MVPHLSTELAQWCLVSQIGRDATVSPRYERMMGADSANPPGWIPPSEGWERRASPQTGSLPGSEPWSSGVKIHYLAAGLNLEAQPRPVRARGAIAPPPASAPRLPPPASDLEPTYAAGPRSRLVEPLLFCYYGAVPIFHRPVRGEFRLNQLIITPQEASCNLKCLHTFIQL